MFRRFFSLSCSAAFTAALVCAGSAAAKTSPVIIDYCHVDYNQGPNVAPSANVSLTKTSGPLEIKFTNESNKTAAMIRFGVTIGEETASVRDVGTFSSGITIHHKFQDFSGRTKFIFAHEPQPRCTVQYIKFADGTTWTVDEE